MPASTDEFAAICLVGASSAVLQDAETYTIITVMPRFFFGNLIDGAKQGKPTAGNDAFLRSFGCADCLIRQGLSMLHHPDQQ